VPSSNGTEQNKQQSVWGRLQERFSKESGSRREDGDEVFDDRPPHRGWAISICALIAVFLWFVFTMQETYTVTMDLPTQVVNVPAEQALAERPPRRIRAQVSGQGFPLLKLKYNTPTISIDAAASEVDLSKSITGLPKSLSLQDVRPATVRLRTEPRLLRTVPIVANTRITTPPTHDLAQPPVIEPDSVTVLGARSVVSELQGWPTERFKREGLKDSITVRVALADTLRRLVQLDTNSVRLTAHARQFTEGTRTINVTVTGEPSNEKWVTLEPSNVQVTYRVLFDQYERAQNAQDFYATVSYDTIRQDTTGRVRPNLNLPEDIDLRDVEMQPSSLRYYNFVQ
jgi:hypothetical protein